MDLKEPVTAIKGVGKSRASLLEKLGIFRISELIEHYPHRHEDRSSTKSISQMRPSDITLFKGQILGGKLIRPRPNLSILELIIDDGTGTLTLIFFNQPYLQKSLPRGTSIMGWGTIERRGRNLICPSPEIEIINPSNQPISMGRIVPVYPLTGGLSQGWLRNLIFQQLNQNILPDDEILPAQTLEKRKFLPRKKSVVQYHFPQDLLTLERARTRLAYEELFIFQMGLFLRKEHNSQLKGIAIKGSKKDDNRFFEELPFELTESQEKAIAQIKADLAAKWPMNRLLHGDVGSGKTVVAASCVAYCGLRNYQCAVMAPTEILASQHFHSFQRFLAPLKLDIALLTGSTKAKEKKEILQRLAQGKLDLLVGTHALFSEGVKFKKMGLAIIDEQHRFGVQQRQLLMEKGKSPNVLLMTATPIPRTLAISFYGDLDISKLAGMPPGRGKIRTHLRDEATLPKIWKFIYDRAKKGERAYIVCPTIGEEDDGYDAASGLYEELKKSRFGDMPMGLVHGRLSPQEIFEKVEDFREGRLFCLISTTVVEVGVDVPQATIMVIMSAERFGLAQLHQLRGRVGRGGLDSHCILITGSRDEKAQERMKAMIENGDGFSISEIDLKLRGPGEYFGTRQHGMPDFKVADILKDTELLEIAREDARKCLEEGWDYSALLPYIQEKFSQNTVG